MKVISSEKLMEFGEKFLCAYGASAENAHIVADHLVSNDLKGVEAQGAMRFFEYARFMVNGTIDGQAEPVVETVGPGAFILDGNKSFGVVALQKATDLMLETLKTMPMSVAAVKSVGHTGRVGAFAEQMAKNRCFCSIYGGGGHKKFKSVAPFGGTKGVMSTNPVTLAMPGMNDIPLSSDFATSASAGGKLRLALRKNAQLPEGQILDKNGMPSRSPEAYFDGGVMLPAGGAKGSGMAMINELLTYGMLGDPVEFNWVMTGFRLNLFCSDEDYDRRTGEFLSLVNENPPAQGFKKVSYPGQFEAEIEKKRRANGIEVSDNVAGQLAEMAAAKGVELPEELK